MDNSVALREVRTLNTQTMRLFSGIYDHTFQITVKCRSKTQYDSKTLYQCLSQYLAERFRIYKSIYSAVAQDDAVYGQYKKDYTALKFLIGQGWCESLLIDKDEFMTIESKLLDREMLHSPRFRLDVRKVYTSPKKRHHYQDQGYFYASTFIYICRQLYRNEEKKKEASTERGLMTNALRYQILQRDGFRCQICGRSQEDGVILHIDHIKPLSKGGKTEPRNLRVLCADCNLGKGARYNPSALN